MQEKGDTVHAKSMPNQRPARALLTPDRTYPTTKQQVFSYVNWRRIRYYLSKVFGSRFIDFQLLVSVQTESPLAGPARYGLSPPDNGGRLVFTLRGGM